MKNFILILFVITISFSANAHSVDGKAMHLRTWTIHQNEQILGSLLMMKNGSVYLQPTAETIVSYPLSDFSSKDQQFIQEKYAAIQRLNTSKLTYTPPIVPIQIAYSRYYVLLAIIILLSISTLLMNRQQRKYSKLFLGVIFFSGLYSFTTTGLQKTTTTTNPSFIDSAFTPFKPHVVTSWDNIYFYVESQGIPTTHTMMVGISNHGWQQQVPIPQCYLLPNAWSIPLNPTIATNPIPVDSIHFTRGAIALAVNGVPIFNVHTNTGVDSYIDGQLDSFGGHCGRADDYHYHIAPLHLYNYTAPTQPIAFALDGFAVYGSVEPEGNPMTQLDANHGHYGVNGVYHYHGTIAAPYMIKNMVGQVTEDTTHQLIPQAAAHPVRPSLTPLSGALITSCISNATPNGYTLTYTKSSQTYKVCYHWNNNGVYTFYFIGPNNDTTTSNYNGFKPCTLPTSISSLSIPDEVIVFPNPANQNMSIQAKNSLHRILIYDLNGRTVLTYDAGNNHEATIAIDRLTPGMYFLFFNNNGQPFYQEFLKQ